MLDEFSHEINKSKLALLFILDYWYMVFIFGALITLMVWLYNRVEFTYPYKSSSQKKWPFYVVGVIVLMLSVTVAVGGIRGGL